jgi:hypothetical protein
METQDKSIQARKPMTEFEYVDFEVEKEPWNRYRLEDKSILKAKFVLINVFAEKGWKQKIQQTKGKKDKVGFAFKLQPISITGVQVPSSLFGPPDSGKYTHEELASSVVKHDLDIEVIAESWNIYRLPEGFVVKVKSSPVNVARTSKFDNEGVPVYLVDLSADIKMGPRK